MDKKDLKQSKKHIRSFKMPFTPKSRLKGNLKYERKFYLDVSTWKDMEDRIHPKNAETHPRTEKRTQRKRMDSERFTIRGSSTLIPQG